MGASFILDSCGMKMFVGPVASFIWAGPQNWLYTRGFPVVIKTSQKQFCNRGN